MSLLAIELNDAGVRAARSGEDGLLALDGQCTSSPGFARMHNETLVTGAAAARQACLAPRAVHNRFWDLLDTEPMDPADRRSPNRAEAACVHLQRLFEAVRRPGEECVMAVPPFYAPEQLGILAGIIRELKLPLKTLVAAPVAAAGGSAVAGTVLLVDLTLHRGVLSVIESGQRVRLVRTRVCADVGVEAFRRQWVKAIGGEFVRRTRFDPLHDAVTEQQLHDGLAEVLDALGPDGSHSLQLAAGSLVHRVAVTEQLLAQSGHSLMFSLCSDVTAVAAACRPAAIVLAYEAARVPGLERLLQQQVAIPVHCLEAGAAAVGLLRAWPDAFDEPETEGIAYHTSRYAAAAPGDGPPGSAVPPRPTHVLLGSRAHRLSQAPLFIAHDGETGRLAVVEGPGAACLHTNGREVVLEIQAGHEVRVDGADVEGAVPVGIGAEITIVGCRETMKLITLT